MNKRFWALAAICGATLCAGILLPRPLMQSWLRAASYYLLFGLVGIWAWLAVRAYGNGSASRIRRHLPALLLALVLTVLVFSISPPRFKILADETNLIGVSLLMHETRTAAIPLEGVQTDYAAPDLVTADVKRPMLFSFLTALLHAVLGYSPNNGFVLNFLISVAVLWLFSLSVTRLLPKIYGIVGLMLLAAAPVYVMCATSSGFELLNLLLVVLVFLLIADTTASGYDRSKTEMLLASLVLLAHCRYESAAVLLIAIPALAVPLWRRGFFQTLSWPVLLLPLFLLPVFWQRMIHWGKPEFNRVGVDDYTLVESPFGWRNLTANIDDNLFVMMGLNPDYGFTPLLFLLAAAGLYLWIRKALTVTPSMFSTRWVSIAGGVFVLLFLIISSFYWGNFGIPMDIRLALVFLPFLCWGAVYALFRMQQDVLPAPRRLPAAGLLLLAVLHLLMFWPFGALQRPLQQLALPYEYERVREYIQTRISDRGNILLVTDLPNLYLVQGYSAVKINRPQPLHAILARPNLFERVLVVQKYDRSSGNVLPPYRLPESGFQLQNADAFPLTPRTGVRISELQIIEPGKDEIP